MSALLIAAITFLAITLISFFIGSYYIDKYYQLLSLTKQQGPLVRCAVRIGVFTFIIPSISLYVGMRLLAAYFYITNSFAQELSTPLEHAPSLMQHISSQLGGFTILTIVLGILFILHARQMIEHNASKKLWLQLFAILAGVLMLLWITQEPIVSLLIANMSTFGLLFLTFRANAMRPSA